MALAEPDAPRHAQYHAMACQARGERALDAPEHGNAPSCPSSPASLRLRRAPSPPPLAARHARERAEAKSPSSSSESSHQYRGMMSTRPSNPIVPLLRQLLLEHHHDAAYATPSLPCPFDRRRRHAVDTLSQQPRHHHGSINRAHPAPNHSHHLTPLPSPLLLAPMEQFTQTEFYQLGNGGGLVFEQDLTELSMFLGRPFPEFFGGQVTDQPGGQLQWVIIADLRGKLEPPMTGRIQFSFRENNWADGLARAMKEALARLCGLELPRIRGTRYFHMERQDSMGAPMDLSPHPELKYHMDHTDYMLCEAHVQLDNSRALANFAYLQMAQKDETIKIIAKERRTLLRENAKKDYSISRLRDKIAALKETIKTQEDQLKALEGEGEGEDIQGDGYSYVSNDNDYEEDDDDLAFYPDEDGHEHLTAGMDDTVPINVDEA
ncbi:hypothetical protein QYE76_066728 [Lolium multiflorum]|uniref:Uncharacterized protein n=1 Tax=Lolium multiflorum TaxID=4521 RepID=A0AAD8SC48_LOLMU|nr:hypothetical protein QYE76_066728 [Lolium multiflorum]